MNSTGELLILIFKFQKEMYLEHDLEVPVSEAFVLELSV